MFTALVWFPYPAIKVSFSMKLCAWGCEPRETRWVRGGGGWQAVTAKDCWLSPVRRQMAVDWPALWQYCAQKARAKCTLRRYGASLGPVAVCLPEIQCTAVLPLLGPPLGADKAG